MQQLETEETRFDYAGMKQNFVELFKQRYNLLQNDAEKLFIDVETFIKNAPLTLTIKANDWFGGATAPNSAFTPAAAFQKQSGLNEIFGKTARKMNDTITHMPTWDDSRLDASEARGGRYLRFRTYKDQIMTGLNEFAANELPVFAALNVNWDGAYGSDTPDKFGSNYYGDMHLKLKRNNIVDRLVYTATDHGSPRRDPMLALNDFAFSGRGLTRLKGVNRPGVIDNVVNAARTKNPVFGQALVYEIQIYGGLDIKTDVGEIILSNEVSDNLENTVKNYYQNAGLNIPINRAGVAPQNALRGLDDSMVQQMLRFNELSKFQKDRIDKSVNTTMAASQASANKLSPTSMSIVMLKSSYSSLYYVENILKSLADTLTDADIVVLQKILATARSMAAGLTAGNDIAANLKTRLSTLVISVDQLMNQTLAARSSGKKRNSFRDLKANEATAAKPLVPARQRTGSM